MARLRSVGTMQEQSSKFGSTVPRTCTAVMAAWSFQRPDCASLSLQHQPLNGGGKTSGFGNGRRTGPQCGERFETRLLDPAWMRIRKGNCNRWSWMATMMEPTLG